MPTIIIARGFFSRFPKIMFEILHTG